MESVNIGRSDDREVMDLDSGALDGAAGADDAKDSVSEPSNDQEEADDDDKFTELSWNRTSPELQSDPNAKVDEQDVEMSDEPPSDANYEGRAGPIGKSRQSDEEDDDEEQAEAEAEAPAPPTKENLAKTPQKRTAKPKAKVRETVNITKALQELPLAPITLQSRTTSQVVLWRDIIGQVAQYSYQTAQGTKGGSQVVAVGKEAMAIVRPFISLFGPEGIEAFSQTIQGYRVAESLRTTQQDVGGGGAVALPPALQGLDANDPRCTTFEALTRVESYELAALSADIRRRYALVKFYEEYMRLMDMMTLDKLKDLGYVPRRGVGRASLVRMYLINLVWPRLEVQPTQHEMKTHQTRLTNQTSYGKGYCALVTSFGAGALLLIPKGWKSKT